MKRTILFSITWIFIASASWSQNWLLGGNPFAGPNGTIISNFFGTSIVNNTPVRFGTAGINRMKLNVLNQNVPNPFAEQTTITYNIPRNATLAQMLFYDVNGRQIKSVDITKKGKGQLNVFANDLSNGIYSYTLIVDGKIFETKKMVKQQ